MATMLLIATNPRIMGTLILGPAMQIVGWLATAVMLLATIGLLVL